MSKSVFFFGDGQAEGDPSRRDLLGGKGAGLAEMTLLGLPVPAGFTLTTEVCRDFARTRAFGAAVRDEVEAALAHLEAVAGARLGDPAAPLLVSVRSGGAVSMPGMMDTVLNLGMNDAVARGLTARTGSARFAFDAHRRFVASYATVVLGVPRAPFERAIDEARARVAAARAIDRTRLNAEELKRRVPDADLPADELEGLARAFRGIVLDRTGRGVPDDARQQLWEAVAAVFASWDNARAVAYRRLHGIADDAGTACTIQAMVFGNLGDTSATAVAFTRDPSTGEPRLTGEWLPNAQGEDIVTGTRTPLPLRADGGAADGASLEARMPDAYRAIAGVGATLERRHRDVQDIELTVQDGKLYVLQCRSAKRAAPAAVRAAVDMAHEGLLSTREAILRVDPASVAPLLRPVFDAAAPKTLLARGLAASPGAASGRIVFDAYEAERLAAAGAAVILVRAETSPEDIGGIRAARGTLTSRGGLTSHAAVVARAIGKPCVAGVSAVALQPGGQSMTVTLRDEAGGSRQVTLKKGDLLSIDGGSGSVYADAVPTVPGSPGPPFDELMTWADAARTMRVRAVAASLADARAARAFGADGLALLRTEAMPAATSDDAHLPAKLREELTDILRATRGCPVAVRLADAPALSALQTRAVIQAAASAADDGVPSRAEILLPNPTSRADVDRVRAIADEVTRELPGRYSSSVTVLLGAAIDPDRALQTGPELAAAADLLCFVTAGEPSLDVAAVLARAAQAARQAQPRVQLAVSSASSDPSVLDVFQRAGFDYIGCGPERVPLLRLAAAHAALRAPGDGRAADADPSGGVAGGVR